MQLFIIGRLAPGRSMHPQCWSLWVMFGVIASIRAVSSERAEHLDSCAKYHPPLLETVRVVTTRASAVNYFSLFIPDVQAVFSAGRWAYRQF